MSDLISRQDAINAICEHGTDLERRGIMVLAVANHKQVTVDLLEKLPSAERKGTWEKTYLDHEAFGVRPFLRYCSACNETAVYAYNFCPNCGADMRGEEDE